MGCAQSSVQNPANAAAEMNLPLLLLNQLQAGMNNNHGINDSLPCRTKISATKLIIKNNQIHRHYVDVSVNDGDEQIIYCCEQTDNTRPVNTNTKTNKQIALISDKDHKPSSSSSLRRKSETRYPDFNKVHRFPVYSTSASPFDLFQSYQQLPSDNQTTLTMVDLMQSLLNHQEALLTGMLPAEHQATPDESTPDDSVSDNDNHSAPLHTDYLEDEEEKECLSELMKEEVNEDEEEQVLSSYNNTTTSGAVLPFHHTDEEDCTLDNSIAMTGTEPVVSLPKRSLDISHFTQAQDERCDTEDSTDHIILATIKQKPMAKNTIPTPTTAALSSSSHTSTTTPPMTSFPLKSYSTNSLTTSNSRNIITPAASSVHTKAAQHHEEKKRRWYAHLSHPTNYVIPAEGEEDGGSGSGGRLESMEDAAEVI